ncbi:MAG TPA: TIGR04283 family arsenosugar biosynthesis glycosyltransferase [Gammaproteobacteria bacterium]|nr:TIGR04283 family arsenosugar biosynthesis glycosyltransferase [Gammaproteobacteria bacterium]
MNGFGPNEVTIVSVCIPVLNEAEYLPHLLAQLQAQRGIGLDIVVADGGSTDGTLQTVPPGVRVVTSAPGRGMQMNAAAHAARGDWLLFLHADTQLEEPRLLADAVEALIAAQARLGHDRVAGHFPLRFERGEVGHALLFRYMEAKTTLNRRGTINGDQGLLLSRRFFESLGGFDTSRSFLEDQAFADRVFAAGRWMTLPGRATTSARRFELIGARRVYAFMALVMIAREIGNDSFLERVPALYAHRLDVSAARAAWRQSWRTQPMRTRWRWSMTVLRYAAGNVWQIIFLARVALWAGS